MLGVSTPCVRRFARSNTSLITVFTVGSNWLRVTFLSPSACIADASCEIAPKFVFSPRPARLPKRSTTLPAAFPEGTLPLNGGCTLVELLTEFTDPPASA
jgi:hypothetical protein